MSTTATFLFASAGLNVRPVLVTASLSGPSFCWLMSVPSTENDVGGDGFWEIVVLLSVSSRPPAAAATPCSAAISVAAFSFIGA